MAIQQTPSPSPLSLGRYGTPRSAQTPTHRKRGKTRWQFNGAKVVALNASGLLFGLQLGLLLTGTSVVAASLGALAMGCFNLSVLMTCRR